MKMILKRPYIFHKIGASPDKLLRKWKVKDKTKHLVQELFSITNIKKEDVVIKQVKVFGIKFRFLNKYRTLLHKISDLERTKLSDLERTKLSDLDKKNVQLNDLLALLYKSLMDSIEIPKNLTDTPITTNNKDKNILQALKSLGKFYFLPNKGNLGDIMIASTEYQYFDAHHLEYSIYDMLQQDNYTAPFNLVYGGGGIWNKVYYREHPEILNIFKSELLKRCVILPSSFNECNEVIETFDERFVVFCRDEKSYHYCQSINKKANFIIADDMVIGSNFDMYNTVFFNRNNINNFISHLSLDKAQKFFELYQRYYNEKFEAIQKLKTIKEYNVGFLLREDNEENSLLNSSLTSMDLSAYFCGYGCDKGYSYICAKFFLEVINKFNIIVTNRLHIGICAAKLGKEVLLLDISTYKKVEGVYHQSLSQFKNVHMTTYEKLNDDLNLLLNKTYPKTKKDNFEINTFKDFMSQYAGLKNEYGIEKRFLNIRLH